MLFSEMNMPRSDAVYWLIMGAVLFVGGLILALDVFSLVRFVGVICMIFGIVAGLLGFMGVPRRSPRTGPA